MMHLPPGRVGGYREGRGHTGWGSPPEFRPVLSDGSPRRGPLPGPPLWEVRIFDKTANRFDRACREIKPAHHPPAPRSAARTLKLRDFFSAHLDQ